jgi:F-type H+-transporting ATPase subunit a
VAPVSVAFALFISIIEIIVTAIQAYIFTVLSALYFGMAVEDHDHH